MKKSYFILCILFLPLQIFAKIQVATTTTDLKAIVDQVGKEYVDVFALAKGTQDPHQIDAKPSFMVKLRSSDAVFAQGLELEAAWIIPLVQGSRNPKLLKKGGTGCRVRSHRNSSRRSFSCRR
jgi:zinc/manganese transport system substrate-binding protein